jgi:hypothetical protein
VIGSKLTAGAAGRKMWQTVATKKRAENGKSMVTVEDMEREKVTKMRAGRQLRNERATATMRRALKSAGRE